MKLRPIILLLALPVCAASQVTQKPWTSWTKADAEKILDDSPWGQTQVGRNMAYEDYSYTVARVNLRIRFLSAKPVRQALARILELSPKEAAAGRIAEALQFADRTFPDTIVVSVSYDAPSGAFPLGAYQKAFAGATTSSLRNNTYLETKGGKRSFLQEYVPPGPDGFGARFIFPRTAGGKPFVTPDGGYLRFYSEFPKMADTTMTSGVSPGKFISFTIDMRFTIADFQYGGALEY